MVTNQYKKVIIIALSTIVLMSLGVTEAIALTSGFVGVSAYKRTGSGCSYSNVAGAEYVTNLASALPFTFVPRFIHTNDFALENSWQNSAPTVDFFAFSGHGFRYDSGHTLRNEAATHFYTLNSSTVFHGEGNENDDRANATWSEKSFNGQPLRWITAQTCNFLTNGGSWENYNKVGRMMQGANLILGFASIMWLDSREANLYGYYIRDGLSFKTAFQEAASWYQRGKGFTVTARVFGWNQAENDTYLVYRTGAPTFINSPGSFATWDRTIN